jgi:hypothetical protein
MGHLHRITKLYVSNGPWPLSFPITAVVTHHHTLFSGNGGILTCKGDGTTSLWRRYNEFELLRNYLECIYPALVIPPLPEKKVW